MRILIKKKNLKDCNLRNNCSCAPNYLVSQSPVSSGNEGPGRTAIRTDSHSYDISVSKLVVEVTSRSRNPMSPSPNFPSGPALRFRCPAMPLDSDVQRCPPMSSDAPWLRCPAMPLDSDVQRCPLTPRSNDPLRNNGVLSDLCQCIIWGIICVR